MITRGQQLDVVFIHHHPDSLVVVEQSSIKVVAHTRTTFTVSGRVFQQADLNKIVAGDSQHQYCLAVRPGTYTAERVQAFAQQQLCWREDTQDIHFCQRAQQEGARIQRRDRWFNASHSGKTDTNSTCFIHSKRPNWTAQGGYRVDPQCEWWMRRQVSAFYDNRL